MDDAADIIKIDCNGAVLDATLVNEHCIRGNIIQIGEQGGEFEVHSIPKFALPETVEQGLVFIFCFWTDKRAFCTLNNNRDAG